MNFAQVTAYIKWYLEKSDISGKTISKDHKQELDLVNMPMKQAISLANTTQEEIKRQSRTVGDHLVQALRQEKATAKTHQISVPDLRMALIRWIMDQQGEVQISSVERKQLKFANLSSALLALGALHESPRLGYAEEDQALVFNQTGKETIICPVTKQGLAYLIQTVQEQPYHCPEKAVKLLEEAYAKLPSLE